MGKTTILSGVRALFKNFMAKLGKGAAQVDLVLEEQAYRPGDEIRGEVVIQGGNVEQQINRIHVELVMTVQVKEKSFSHVVHTYPLSDSFTIAEGERKSIPFSCLLPKDLPLSGNKVAYAFHTHLDIAAGVDKNDHDPIQVLPPERLQQILDAFASLGLREKYDSRSFNGYAQEFELFPTDFLQDRVEEVEFVAVIEDAGIRLLLEVDRLTPMGEQEIRRELYLENDTLEDVSSLTNTLRQYLEEMVENPHAFTQFGSHAYGDGQHKHSFLSKYGGAIGGFAAGVIGGLVLAELMDGVTDTMEEALDLPDVEEMGEGMLDDFFGDGED